MFFLDSAGAMRMGIVLASMEFARPRGKKRGANLQKFSKGDSVTISIQQVLRAFLL